MKKFYRTHKIQLLAAAVLIEFGYGVASSWQKGSQYEIALTIVWVVVISIAIATVISHEMGHFLMAKKLGLTCRFTRSERGNPAVRIEEDPIPSQALAIFLAGPLGGLAIDIVAIGIALLCPNGGQFPVYVTVLHTSIIEGAVICGIANLFNLIPVKRMDGAHALVAWRSIKATRCV